MKLSILTITKNDITGLIETAHSIDQLLRELKNEQIKIEWIIKSGDIESNFDHITSNISNSLQKITKFYYGKDSGIYDAMTQAVAFATGDCIIFMNSGDSFIVQGTIKLLKEFNQLDYLQREKVILYGNSYWESGLAIGFPFLPRFLPRLGRLPSHQTMLIPLSIQRSMAFDSCLPISADQDFKIRTFLSGISYIHVNEHVAISKSGGISQQIINHEALLKRSFESFQLMKKNYSLSWGYIYFVLFYTWNLRKLFSNRLIISTGLIQQSRTSQDK